eukprot:CAMPEP_0168414372 /NCGR_PEP_ID=MMETSP0228-20121227/29691_1 /TAXON_ID=133427 /ORGANISM="Protoceratium reticulatum, Strain CCCM 535 (=CCMP 1889)" /LENGTH=85 /DNA_ID=CAMNT_0008428165 /DNA_START=535 /DNA_END=788 /DNA_ORIENTATION=+
MPSSGSHEAPRQRPGGAPRELARPPQLLRSGINAPWFRFTAGHTLSSCWPAAGATPSAATTAQAAAAGWRHVARSSFGNLPLTSA